MPCPGSGFRLTRANPDQHGGFFDRVEVVQRMGAVGDKPADLFPVFLHEPGKHFDIGDDFDAALPDHRDGGHVAVAVDVHPVAAFRFLRADLFRSFDDPPLDQHG